MVRCAKHSCFGASTGISSEEWWYELFLATYRSTENLSQVKDDELLALMPDLMNILFREVFSSKVGWKVKEDAVYTLQKLKDWKDYGAGPRIGVVTNYDDRMNGILKGNLFPLTSTQKIVNFYFQILDCSSFLILS